MKEDKETINSLWDDCSETAGQVNSWTEELNLSDRRSSHVKCTTVV